MTPTNALVASDGRIWYSSFSGSALGELDPKTLLSRVYTLPDKRSVFDVAAGAGGVIWYTTANAPGGNDTVGRLNLDSARRSEMESTCALTGRVEPVYNETYQAPAYYYGGGYIRPYPPRPLPPPPPKQGKPVDLYKVPSAPRR